MTAFMFFVAWIVTLMFGLVLGRVWEIRRVLHQALRTGKLNLSKQAQAMASTRRSLITKKPRRSSDGAKVSL
jgi:hypothetical protein